jgi:hypothetical protein
MQITAADIATLANDNIENAKTFPQVGLKWKKF